MISQPSDTIMVEVNDKAGGNANILESVHDTPPARARVSLTLCCAMTSVEPIPSLRLHAALSHSFPPLRSSEVNHSLIRRRFERSIDGLPNSFLGFDPNLVPLKSNIICGQVKGVYEQGGMKAFFKGALPRALKSALNIALQFFLYDSLKRIANVAPDDLKVG